MPVGARWRSPRLTAIGLLVLAVAAACAHVPSAERLDPVRTLVRERIGAGDAVSLAVGVARGERILWEEAFGWADAEARVPADPHTMYSLASVSKPLTATGLMLLVERAEVDLDRPVNDYLGQAAIRVRTGRAQDATVRRVANHTAGLPPHHHFFPHDEARRPPPMEVTIRRYGQAVAPPGEQFQYSNLGYAILEHLIERVSGRAFGDFMEAEVIRPLGLEHTALVLDPARHPDRASRYRSDGSPLPFYDFDHRGASAFYACVHDLVRFGMFHLEQLDGEPPLLSGRARRLMRRAAAGRPGRDYGVGWSTYRHTTGAEVVEHGGNMPGVSALLALVPEQDLVVAVVASAAGDVARRIGAAVLDALLPARPPPAGDAHARRAPGPSRERADRSRRPPGWARGTWSGSLDTGDGTLAMRLSVAEDGARARLGAREERPVLGLSLQGDWLTGVVLGEIGAADAARQPHTLRLAVRRRGSRLQGTITAVSVPGRQLPLALSFWVDLERPPAPGR